MAKKLIPDFDRLMKSAEVTIDSCWIWSGKLDRDGYALQMKVGSRTDGSRRAVKPHRLMYESLVGPIPEGMTIDHLCRRRCCVNPEHLEAVAGKVNTQRGWRATKLYCKRGHPLFGENLAISSSSGFRYCRTCQRASIRDYYRKTGGAAQKKYDEKNRDKRRADQAARRAAWSPERLEYERSKARAYDKIRRPGTGGLNRIG